MKYLSIVIGAVVATAVMLKAALVPAASAPTPAAEGTQACPALLNYSFPGLQDEKPQSLCQYAGRVVLVVNTASQCGFTSQYRGLEALYRKHQGDGLGAGQAEEPADPVLGVLAVHACHETPFGGFRG